MTEPLHQPQPHMGRYLLIHLIITAVVPLFVNGVGGIWDYLLVLLAAGLLLAIIDRRYGSYLFWSFIFLTYLVKEIIVSNLVLAWLIVQPKPKLDRGIIAIPLTVTTSLEITVLSLAIAATPGTLIVELGSDQPGHYVLYVHNINVGDPNRFRATIKDGFERMILQISRGVTA